LKRLKAGIKAAKALPEVDETHLAMFGFCFGGLCTLDAARAGIDLKAAISFHGLLEANAAPGQLHLNSFMKSLDSMELLKSD